MKNMKKILFLGDSNETLELLLQAKEEGLYTIVTDYCSPERSTAKLAADEYWMISTGDLDALEIKCKQNGINAIISGTSDFNLEMSIKLCERLCLPTYCTEKVWYQAKNKFFLKKVCKETNVPVPTDYYVTLNSDTEKLNNIEYPVMVKPIDREGNVGVSFCYNSSDLMRGIVYAQSVSKCDDVIVEQMIIGREFFSYYILAEGEAKFLTLGIRLSQPGFPKYCYSMNTTLNNFTTHYLESINDQVVEMLKKIGCKEGVACIQGMMDAEGNFFVFEMCYSLEGSILVNPLRKIYEFDVIKWQLECALGVKHSKSQLLNLDKKIQKGYANSYILFTCEKGIIQEIVGLEKLKKYPNISIHIHAHIGDYVDKYKPLGNIMFYAYNYDEICEIINYINSSVKVLDNNGNNILIYFKDVQSINSIL